LSGSAIAPPSTFSAFLCWSVARAVACCASFASGAELGLANIKSLKIVYSDMNKNKERFEPANPELALFLKTRTHSNHKLQLLTTNTYVLQSRLPAGSSFAHADD
jgi:hypothetical protein